MQGGTALLADIRASLLTGQEAGVLNSTVSYAC